MKKLNLSLVLIFVVALFCSLLPSDAMAQDVIAASKVPDHILADAKKRLPGKKASKWLVSSWQGSDYYVAEYEVAGKMVNKYKTGGTPFSTVVSYDIQAAKAKLPDKVKKLQALLGANCLIELNDSKAASFFTMATIEEKKSSFSVSSVKGKTDINFNGSGYSIDASDCETSLFDDADLPALKSVFWEFADNDGKVTKTDASLADQIIKFKEMAKKRGWNKANSIVIYPNNSLTASFDNNEQTFLAPIMAENNKPAFEFANSVEDKDGNKKKEIVYFKDSDKPKALFEEGKFYAIQSKKSGKYLDIPKNSKENGVNVVQFGGKMTPNEQFKFVKQADGSYKITAKHSNKSVTSGEGGFLVQLDKGDDSKQNWTIKDAGNGFVTLILQASGTVADVYDGSVEDGGRIWAYNSNGSDAQLWKLIEVK